MKPIVPNSMFNIFIDYRWYKGGAITQHKTSPFAIFYKFNFTSYYWLSVLGSGYSSKYSLRSSASSSWSSRWSNSLILGSSISFSYLCIFL